MKKLDSDVKISISLTLFYWPILYPSLSQRQTYCSHVSISLSLLLSCHSWSNLLIYIQTATGELCQWCELATFPIDSRNHFWTVLKIETIFRTFLGPILVRIIQNEILLVFTEQCVSLRTVFTKWGENVFKNFGREIEARWGNRY